MSRGYGIDENVKSEGSGIATFEPGINENVRLTNVSYGIASAKDDADPNGAKALIFEFENADGDLKLRHLEWEVNEQLSMKGAESLYDKMISNGQTITETKLDFVNKQVDKAYSSQASRIKHIMTKFLDEASVIITSTNSFEAYAKKVVGLLKPALDDRNLRLICVYNPKGYMTLPSFTPFLEVMVDGVNTSLKIKTTYHNIVKPAPTNGAGYGGGSKAPVSDNDDF